jgi:glycosyltransferase XagB
MMSYIPHQRQADRGNDNLASLDGLPLLPRSFLPTLFERLSKQDRELVLRAKILPVAYLPNLTLYGAVGEAAQRRAQAHGLNVVAQIAETDFRKAIHEHLASLLLDKATHGLKKSMPRFSAHVRMTQKQVAWVFFLFLLLSVSAVSLPIGYFHSATSFIFGLFFLSVISLRLFSLIGLKIPRQRNKIKLCDDELPAYSVLVPVFRETSVLAQLINALSRLNYPKGKLDIKIIVEESDLAMHRALANFSLPEYFDIIIVPTGKPQTKPRALNYALQFAWGDLLTIYDAEDIPEPMQLRKAVEKFESEPKHVACLQAELAFYNPNENWLTRGIRAQMPQEKLSQKVQLIFFNFCTVMNVNGASGWT